MNHHVRMHRVFALALGGILTIGGLSIALTEHLTPMFVRDAAPALMAKIAWTTPLERPAPPSSGKAIVADLDAMEVTLVENGEDIVRLPIASKGRAGTPWETPTGSYDIKTKEIEHYSSIGEVWMPYSMQFYGNYFIHGWPTDKDGVDVPEGYSGGCIRLRTSAAKQVYEFAEIGMPLVVRGAKGTPSAMFRYYLRGGGTPPDIAANAFIVADIKRGDVLWERNARAAVPLGKATALMTGVVALETVNQYKVVRMGELLLGKGVLRRHKTDAPDELPIGSLIYPLMFDANATAAEAFAVEHGPEDFVARMNEKARAIGMTNTTFADPWPSAENSGSAHDLVTLLETLDERKRFLLDASLAPKKEITEGDGTGRFSWHNDDPWVVRGDVRYRGGIFASTSDESVFAGIMSIPVGEFADRDFAIVLLGSSDAGEDIERIRTFVAQHFYWGPERDAALVAEENESIASILRDFFGLGMLKKKLYDVAIGDVS